MVYSQRVGSGAVYKIPAIYLVILGIVMFIAFGKFFKEGDSVSTPKLVTPCSAIHFIAGMLVARLTPLSFVAWTFTHIGFEIIESSRIGESLFTPNGILSKITEWISEKLGINYQWSEYKGDSAVNSNADTAFALLGYIIGKI